jgi:hypothetical protein
MDKRTVAILVTVASTLLCCCPGLFLVFFGAMFMLVGAVPGANIDVFGSSDPQAARAFGAFPLCAGVVLLVVAAVVIFFVWRRRRNQPSQ